MSDTMEDVLARWMNAEEIRLRAGEIDPETMRTVLAVTRGFASQVRDAHDAELETECKKAYLEGADEQHEWETDD